MSEIGHNSVDAPRLKAFIERIERLEEDKKAIADDIKDVYAEAKGTGYDPKIMRKVVRLRKVDAAKRQEEEETLDAYMRALGILADTPLGRAAMALKKAGATVSIHPAARSAT